MSDKETKSTAGSTDSKLEEYFQLKKSMRELRADLKDLTTQHQDYENMQKILKEVKIIRDKIKEDEDIKMVNEKVSEVKERMDLLKELIRVDLIENAMPEIKKDGKKLKLVYILKELKEDQD